MINQDLKNPPRLSASEEDLRAGSSSSSDRADPQQQSMFDTALL